MTRTTRTDDGWTAAARVGVLLLAVALPLSTLVYFGFYPGGYVASLEPAWKVVAAWLLTAAFVPIHLGHLRHGLRDEVPPHGRSTFAAMLAVMAAGQAVVGGVWTPMLASLVASALLVFRPPWSVLWAVGVTLSCLPLGAGVFGEGGWYVTVVGAFRSTTLFTLVWLVAGVRRLGLAREVLAQRATARERARVDAGLLRTLRQDLERIESEARRAGAEFAAGDGAAARRALEELTGDARAALASARDVVADMRHPSSRQELQAAARLLSLPQRRQA